MNSSSHRDEETQCLLKRHLDSSGQLDEEAALRFEEAAEKEKYSFLLTTNDNKSNFRRLLLICVVATMFYVSIAFIGATIKRKASMQQLDLEEDSMGTVELSNATGIASMQTVQIVYVQDALFYCENDHVTSHCREMNVLHKSSLSTNNDAVIYDSLDGQHQLVEFKNVSYICPSNHVTETKCSRTAPNNRKICDRGQYNLETVPVQAGELPYHVCKQCPTGTYQPDGLFLGNKCSTCPRGTWVSFTGAISIDRCTVAAYEAMISNSTSTANPIATSAASDAVALAAALPAVVGVTPVVDPSVSAATPAVAPAPSSPLVNQLFRFYRPEPSDSG